MVNPERGSRHKKNPRGGQPRQRRYQKAKVDKSVARRRNHDQDGRVRAALEKAERDRLALEARIALEAEQPVLGPAPGALWAELHKLEDEAPAPVEPVAPAAPVRPVLPAWERQGDDWTMAQARSLLRQGYHIVHVAQITGWGLGCFDDMPVDTDGYGLTIEEWQDQPEAQWTGDGAWAASA